MRFINNNILYTMKIMTYL